MVLKEFGVLQLKMNNIIDTLNDLVHTQRVSRDEPTLAAETPEVHNIMQKFPLHENTLLEVENWLGMCHTNKTALVCREYVLFTVSNSSY